MERHRVDENAFTRERKLPLPQLVRFLLNCNYSPLTTASAPSPH
jgi:hypothetical protein